MNDIFGGEIFIPTRNFEFVIDFKLKAVQETANALHRAISQMEEKGLQDDPRYAQLLAMRARACQTMQQQQQQHNQPFQQSHVKFSLNNLK